jgi:oxygen-independent coproporphyrinogen-3 oxidase
MSVADLTRHFARIEGDAIGNAFTSRRAVMPWQDKQPLAPEDIPAVWSRLMLSRGSQRGRLAYIHVPFCANHCLFCGFYRNAYTPQEASAYADIVIAEIEREASEPVIGDQPIQALYFGGGTPSAFSAKELERILRTVKRHLPLAADCEITIEGRIIHFDEDKIDACIEAGTNRISIGVQSFDSVVRRRQGRRSDKDEAIRFLEGIRDRNRVALVIDLLFGLPGQTEAIWREDLRISVDLAPDGVDLYGLNLIPTTPLFQAVKAGKFQPLTFQDMGAMYRIGAEFLGASGWSQISNSHWARTARERNVYNLRIKEGADCLAYGSGAGGSIGRHSYSLAGKLQQYRDDIAAGRKPLNGMSVSDDLQPARDHVIAGFEVGRLDIGGLDVPHIADAASLFVPLLEQWQVAGLVRIENEVVHLTTAGRFWYSNLIAAFNDILASTMPSRAQRAAMQPPFPPNHRQRVHSMNEISAAENGESVDRVRQALAAKPDGVLEAVATQHNMPLQAVIECLPGEMWKRISGDHFVDVMQEISGWGDIIAIVHTKDVIFEFNGRLPGGALGHGFFNLKGGSALSGHLRHLNCRAIVFLRRPFMGMDTLSVQFLNAHGEAMFKIFVGRNEERRLKADQVERFAQLERRFASVSGDK